MAWTQEWYFVQKGCDVNINNRPLEYQRNGNISDDYVPQGRKPSVTRKHNDKLVTV